MTTIFAILSMFMVGAHAQRRAIMEGLAASNNTVFVDTTTTRLGIGTASPSTALDVNGSAQFGSGATKSTFTATGFLTIAGSTLTVAGSGIISAPSQPGASVARTGTQAVNTGVYQDIFWQSSAAPGYINQSMIDITNSSSTFTVPAGGGGFYIVCPNIRFAPSAIGRRIVRVLQNGSEVRSWESSANAAAYESVGNCQALNLAASDAIRFQAYQDSGGDLNIFSDAAYATSVTVQKAW